MMLVDSAGNVLQSKPSGQYGLGIIMRQTVALGIGSAVWAMHNPPAGTTTVSLRKIRITQSFDGAITALAATNTLSYSISRFAGTSLDTGTGLGTPIKFKNAGTAASAVVGKVDGGTAITGTGIVIETPFAYCSLSLASTVGILGFPILGTPLVAPNEAVHEFTFGVEGSTFGAFELAPGEGITFRVTSVATLIGSVLSGALAWDERPV